MVSSVRHKAVLGSPDPVSRLPYQLSGALGVERK